MGPNFQQIDRCKEALSVLSASAGELRADSGHSIAVAGYLTNVIAQWQQQQPEVKYQLDARGKDPQPSIIAERTLTHALINILNNAGDVSPDQVDITARWSWSTLTLEIRDYGPGFSPEVLTNAGKAPISTKDKGMGVGLFLANATIVRLGGTLEAFNMESGGASTRLKIPLLSEVHADGK